MISLLTNEEIPRPNKEIEQILTFIAPANIIKKMKNISQKANFFFFYFWAPAPEFAFDM